MSVLRIFRLRPLARRLPLRIGHRTWALAVLLVLSMAGSGVARSQSCTYTLNPTSASIGSDGGSGFSVSVTIPPTCVTTGDFLAKSNDSWIHLVGGVAHANGEVQYVGSTVTYNVDPNPYTTSDTGTITIAGKTFTVYQAGAPSCTYSLNPTSVSVGAQGGSGFSVAVTIPPTCVTTGDFFAKSNDSWIHLVGGGANSNGQVQYVGSIVTYNVDPNPYSTPDVGTITIAGKTFTVYQAGAGGGQSINIEGLWWASPAGSESGWGINFAHQGDVVFATWFTYDAAGKAWWLSMTANRTARMSIAGRSRQPRSAVFGAPVRPVAVTHAPVGTATLTSSTPIRCNSPTR